MVTKLAPKKITGTAMGGWFLSFASLIMQQLLLRWQQVQVVMAEDPARKKNLHVKNTLRKLTRLAIGVESNCALLLESAEQFNLATDFAEDDTTALNLPKELNSMVWEISFQHSKPLMLTSVRC